MHGLVAPGATVFPPAIALAATWDTALVARVAARDRRRRREPRHPAGALAGDQHRERRALGPGGGDVRRGPVARRRRWRAHSCGAFERAGVVATPKHFVANVGDGGRDSYPIDVDERAARREYFPPFKAAIQQAGARSVMAAYNSVDGLPATQNRVAAHRQCCKRRMGIPRLRDLRRGGDRRRDRCCTSPSPNTAGAAKHALEAGLDVIFQSLVRQYRPYLAGVRARADLRRRSIDAAVARVLRAKFAARTVRASVRRSRTSAARASGSAGAPRAAR